MHLDYPIASGGRCRSSIEPPGATLSFFFPGRAVGAVL